MSEHPRKLQAITLETTLRCDQSCVFCGSRAGKEARSELSTAEIAHVLEQAGDMGANEVELVGGETYMRDDWVDIIRMATQLGMTCAMVTAGRAIDDRMATMARDAGLDRVSVSIDGTRETHQSLRRTPEGYELGLRAMNAFRNAGVAVGCNTQVNASNWENLNDLAELLLGMGLYAWQIQLMIPMGRAADRPELWLQPYDLLKVIPRLAGVIERCARSRFAVYAGDNVGYFGPHESTLRRFASTHRHTMGCAAGTSVVAVDCEGRVTGCSALDGVCSAAGNVREEGLAAIYERVETPGQVPDSVWGFCATCYYASICRGGCTSTAIALTGRAGNNPYCHHRALELAREGKRERLSALGMRRDGARGHVAFDVVTESVPTAIGSDTESSRPASIS